MNDYASAFKALSDSTRLRIAVLLTRGELCVCDLTSALAAPQSTVSRHMSRLKLSELVADRRRGKWVYYRLADPTGPAHDALLATIRALSSQKPYTDDLAKLVKHRCSPTRD